MPQDNRIVIVGAGVGGLVAALLLAARGCAVTVIERAAQPGGKIRTIEGADAGPTVLTMLWVFEEIFAEAGLDFASALKLAPAEILARHAWGQDRLDLFADPARSADAIGVFAGAGAARGFIAFLAEAKAVYDALERSFMRAERPTQLSLVANAAARGELGQLMRIRPFASLWSTLGRFFPDPRLRQLFGRYATYSGNSPFEAPATLMLIAHVEQSGVWLVEGGLAALATALETAARAHGAVFRYGETVAEIHARAVTLASGERIEADCVIANADPNALATGRFGRFATRAATPTRPADRSLSAITLTGRAAAHGFPLSRHNVFFGADYAREFEDIARGEVPGDPTIYVHAQDRDAGTQTAPQGPERLHIICNAPPLGDTRPHTQSEIHQCEQRIFARLAQCGLTIEPGPHLHTTTPAMFEAMFPATGGALYGRSTHGAAAAFQRPGARTRMPGLYLAGGGAHPGAGVPMAALSGRLAAHACLADLASMRPSRPVATPGGISTRSRTAAATG